MDKLLPCPFCGGEMSPIVMCVDKRYTDEDVEMYHKNGRFTGFNDYIIRCYHCGAISPSGSATKEQAISAWNRRAKGVHNE